MKLRSYVLALLFFSTGAFAQGDWMQNYSVFTCSQGCSNGRYDYVSGVSRPDVLTALALECEWNGGVTATAPNCTSSQHNAGDPALFTRCLGANAPGPVCAVAGKVYVDTGNGVSISDVRAVDTSFSEAETEANAQCASIASGLKAGSTFYCFVTSYKAG